MRPMLPVFGAISGWKSTTCSMRLMLRCHTCESSMVADCLSAAGTPTFVPRCSCPVNPAPPKSIILVDDEKSYNDLIKQMLAENLDAPVHGFTRPLDALDAIVALDPGMVVTDYFMPEMNGIEFI